MNIFETIKKNIDGKNISVVLPEATDKRILGAAARLQSEKILQPILIGNPDEVNQIAQSNNFDITGITIYDPENYDKFDEMVKIFVERRKGKASEEDARKILKNVNYFGTMLCFMDIADCMVSGAIHATGDTVRPALQIIKTKEGVKKTSGAFVMISPNNEKYIFADCAINITLSDEEMAMVAIESAKTAKSFGIDPKVAMLSFSTKGSAKADEAIKVQNATEIAKKLDSSLIIDGELQFDAAFVESVGKQKAPNSEVAGKANVFVFPSLEAGNIGYKIAQRLGNFEAVGPILQGLNKPVNDLSRGCSEDDVYNLALISASQTLS